jgi:leukotriene-A4 hydrolase
MSEAELDEWLHGSGIPASARHARSQRRVALDARTAAWLKGELATAQLDTKRWTARPQMQAFLMRVGRQKFVVPLYTALRANPEDRAWAEKCTRRRASATIPRRRAVSTSRWSNSKGTEECNR